MSIWKSLKNVFIKEKEEPKKKVTAPKQVKRSSQGYQHPPSTAPKTTPKTTSTTISPAERQRAAFIIGDASKVPTRTPSKGVEQQKFTPKQVQEKKKEWEQFKQTTKKDYTPSSGLKEKKFDFNKYLDDMHKIVDRETKRQADIKGIQSRLPMTKKILDDFTERTKGSTPQDNRLSALSKSFFGSDKEQIEYHPDERNWIMKNKVGDVITTGAERFRSEFARPLSAFSDRPFSEMQNEYMQSALGRTNTTGTIDRFEGNKAVVEFVRGGRLETIDVPINQLPKNVKEGDKINFPSQPATKAENIAGNIGGFAGGLGSSMLWAGAGAGIGGVAGGAAAFGAHAGMSEYGENKETKKAVTSALASTAFYGLMGPVSKLFSGVGAKLLAKTPDAYKNSLILEVANQLAATGGAGATMAVATHQIKEPGTMPSTEEILSSAAFSVFMRGIPNAINTVKGAKKANIAFRNSALQFGKDMEAKHQQAVLTPDMKARADIYKSMIWDINRVETQLNSSRFVGSAKEFKQLKELLKFGKYNISKEINGIEKFMGTQQMTGGPTPLGLYPAGLPTGLQQPPITQQGGQTSPPVVPPLKQMVDKTQPFKGLQQEQKAIVPVGKPKTTELKQAKPEVTNEIKIYNEKFKKGDYVRHPQATGQIEKIESMNFLDDKMETIHIKELPTGKIRKVEYKNGKPVATGNIRKLTEKDLELKGLYNEDITNAIKENRDFTKVMKPTPKQDIKPTVTEKTPIQPVEEVKLSGEYGTEKQFDSLEKAVRKELGEVAKDVKGPLFKTGTPKGYDKEHQITEKAVKAVMGKDVVFYEAAHPLGDGANGILHDGKVYVNINADNPYHVVAGHEVTHAMEQMGGTAFKEFEDAVNKYFDTEKGASYKESLEGALRTAYKNPDYKLSDKELMSEVMADFGGEMWNDPEFWQELHKKSPTLVQKVIDAIKKILDGIKNYFKTQIDPNTRVSRFIKDLEKVRGTYVNATKEFMDKTGTSKGVKFSPKREPVAPFYSKMEKVIQRKMPEKTTARTVEKMLKVHGITKDEIMWSGMDDWLRGKEKVTRKEVLDFVKENDLQVQEVTLGKMSPENRKKYEGLLQEEGTLVQESFDLYEKITGKEIPFAERFGDQSPLYAEKRLIQLHNEGVKSSSDMTPLQLAEIKKNQKKIEDISTQLTELEALTPDPKYNQHFFKGGENYTELLFTIPEKKLPDATPIREYMKQVNTVWNYLTDEMNKIHNNPEYRSLSEKVVAERSPEFRKLLKKRTNVDAKYEEAQKKLDNIEFKKIENRPFRGPHFDSEPNILAHTRFSDMQTPDGKDVLFIGEIQSDWHAEGRQKGYIGKYGKDYIIKEDPNDKGVYKIAKKGQEGYLKIDGEIGWYSEKGARDALQVYLWREGGRKPSDAPLKENWHEFVLKRMLRYAAENGYDKLAIATGDMQKDLYNLRKHVDSIVYRGEHLIYIKLHKDESLVGHLTVDKKSGKVEEGMGNGQPLSDVLGKEIANKILKGEGTPATEKFGEASKNKTLSGLDLELGGKAHNEFYDNKVVNYLNKYAKKWGAKVRKEVVGDVDKDLIGGKSIAEVEKIIEQARKHGGGADGVHVTHTIDITDAMKESVMYEGQPKFSIRRQEGKDEGAKPKIHTKKEAKKLTDKGESRLQKLYRKWFDRQDPFRRAQQLQGKTDADKDIMKLAANAVKARGTSQYILSDALVNRVGEEIGQSLNAILKGIPKDALKSKEFEKYLLERHNIARMEQDKPVFNKEHTAEISRKNIAEYDKKYPEFREKAKQLDKFQQKFMEEWAVKSGLLSKEAWDAMKEMYPHYVPTHRVFTELEKYRYKFHKGNKVVGQSAGIKKATGSERDILSPIESTMANVDRIVNAARFNEVGQAILHAAQENSDGMAEFVEVVPTKADVLKEIPRILEEEGIEGISQVILDSYNSVSQRIPKGDNIVKVMVEGNPVLLKINNLPFLEAVTGMHMGELGALEKWGKKITNPMKQLITQKNILFAATNFMRDVPTAYTFGSVHNPAKFVYRLAKGMQEMLADVDEWKTYKALGGPQAGFFNNEIGKLIVNDSLWNKTGNFLTSETINEFIEQLHRYNEFKHVYRRELKKGKSKEAATQAGLFASGEVTVNFGRSGADARSVDSFVLYFNAATQGLDKLGRELAGKSNNPVWRSLLKGITIMTLPALLLLQANKDDPDYQRLDNWTKDNNYLIPMGDGKFFKIPKARELAVTFGLFAERMFRYFKDDPKAFEGMLKSIQIHGPDLPTENILKPIYNLQSNKDFADRTIVPRYMQDRTPKNQYDEQTSEIAKFIGNMMGWSPKKVDYIFRSYTGIIAQVLQPLTTAGTSIKERLLNVVERRFVADAAYSDRTLNDFYEARQELITKRADLKMDDKKLDEKDANRMRIFDTVSPQISDYFAQIRKETDKKKARELREKANVLALDALKEINSKNPISKNEFIIKHDDLFYGEHTRVIIQEDTTFKQIAEAEKQGLPRKKALDMVEEWRALKPLDGNVTVTPSQKLAHLEDSNLTEKQKQAMYDIFLFRPQKDQKENIQKAENQGVSREIISDVYRQWSTLKPLEGNQTVTPKQKRQELYNRTDLTKEQKDIIYDSMLFRPTKQQQEKIETASQRGVSRDIVRDVLRVWSDLEPEGVNKKGEPYKGVRKVQKQNALRNMGLTTEQRRVIYQLFLD